ncbi:MAG TPA: sigma-70 family RNA polymerase sigma factor [Candidatus Nanoarchaeia archaeon]|nr:sigma-70 family RNA polymerase sigma factor [Candidatus Nanoarchaeia archaeon]
MDNCIDIQEQFEQEETNQKLLELLKKLPERERTLLILKYRDGLSIKEISRILDVKPMSLYIMHQKIFTKLKTALE